uniref:Uncharacterized protein n=1 Tax=Trichuris muris TaxID=70415 RepID=A0A5S6QTJ2_TRIMR
MSREQRSGTRGGGPKGRQLLQLRKIIRLRSDNHSVGEYNPAAQQCCRRTHVAQSSPRRSDAGPIPQL